MSSEWRHYISIIAVIGAWLGGLGVIFSVLCFTFAIINPRLFRIALIWLVAADVGILIMLGALAFLIQETTLWVFDLAGIALLIAITVFVFLVVRLYVGKDQLASGFVEGTRRRIEF